MFFPLTAHDLLIVGSAYLPINSNWQQYIDSAETVFEDLKLESRQLLSIKADETCRLMEDEAYKKDLWMWDQDWSIQELKLKKQTVKKKKKTVDNDSENIIPTQSENHINSQDTKTRSPEPNFEVLNEEYLDFIDNMDKKKTEVAVDLNESFRYLYDLKDLLPKRKPYLPGYPAWYRKLCTKPGKDPDWSPGANNITTSMQVTIKMFFRIIFSRKIVLKTNF